MNLEKLKNQALAELKADKKKAGLLGCLLVVAVIVLARMMLSGSPASASAAATASPAPAPATAQPAVKVEAPSASDLASRQKREQYLQTMDRKITRDLFAPNTDYFPPEQVKENTTVTSTAGSQQADEQKDNRATIGAQARSLAVQSTMLSATPIAIINGRVLKKGDFIGGFEIVGIASHSCTVKKDDVTLTLEMSN